MAAYAAIQINYNPQITYPGNALNNIIGATLQTGVRGLPTFTNLNSLFIAKSGSDSNAGTTTMPFLTLNHAVSNLVSGSGGTKYIVFLDSGTYSETLNMNLVPATYPAFVGIFAADGQTPIIQKSRGATIGTYGAGNLARATATLQTANIYVSKAGSDSNNGLTPATAVLTIAHALTLITAGQVIQIQDSGVYQEDISFGSTAGTIQAAAGQAPTLKASSPILGNGQISWTTNSALATIDGLIVDGSGSVNYCYRTTNVTYANSSITFKNCSFINQQNMTAYSSAVFTNCLFQNVVTFALWPGGSTFSYNAGVSNSFTNCLFNCQLSEGLPVFMPIGWRLGTVQNCTFVNAIVTGSIFTGYTASTVPVQLGGIDSNATFDACFFNNSSMLLDYQGTCDYHAYVTSNTFAWTLGITNSTALRGQISLNIGNSPGGGGSTSYQVTATITNCTIYAYGFTSGIGIFSPGGNTQQEIGVMSSSITNCVVSGATNGDIQIQRWAAQVPATTVQNCTTLNGGNYGLTIGGWTSNFTPSNLTVTGLLDSGSPAAWSISLYTPTVSLSGGNVISSVEGTENCTLAASSGGNFAGPKNSNGGNTSIGFDMSSFDISLPCTFNGITWQGWSYPTLPAANMEGGVQSSTGQALTFQNCTFETSGTFGIKAGPGTIVTDCLFAGTTGHAIASNQTAISVTNSIGVGCAGAFVLNYGQFATIKHNTAYACEYGEYDAIQVAAVTSDSNIFNGSGVYDYSGAATLTYSCAATLDPNTQAALDTHSIQLDPLFRNANASTAAGVQLQALAYQYLWNSPCIGAASDGTDMGAWNFTYGPATTAWSLIDFSAIDSPGSSTPNFPYRNPDKVEREMVSVKLANGDREDGAIYSVAATYKKQYTYTWEEHSSDMPAGQRDALLEMFVCPTNQIRLNIGDGRGFFNAFFDRQQGFEYTDMTGVYSQGSVPQPLKRLVLREA